MVLMLSFDSSIKKSADLKTHPSTVNRRRRKSGPYTNICKIVQHFSNKWLKTTNLQLSKKSFRTCLRKMTIIAPFIPSNNLLFFFRNCAKNCPELRMKQKRPLKVHPPNVVWDTLILFNSIAGVYIFLFITFGGKNWLKGDIKRGEMHIFSPIGKKYAYFFPYWHKIYKIAQKKGWKYFACDVHPLFIINCGGKNINQEGGGAKIWTSNLIYTPAQLTVEGCVFKLSYKLLNTSVTLFLHILWRDSHSWPKAPHMYKN